MKPRPLSKKRNAGVSLLVPTKSTGKFTVAGEVRKRHIGLIGELLVVNFEIRKLQLAGLPELAEKVEHVSQIDGDGLGYDIRSFSLVGTEKLIEVKATTGEMQTPFFVTANELKVSQLREKQYFVYRVSNVLATQSIWPKLIIYPGRIDKHFDLNASQYEARR